MEKRETRFIETSNATILLLVLFFPVGLFLMFKYEHFSKRARIIVTSLILIFVIIGMGIDDDIDDNQNLIVDDNTEKIAVISFDNKTFSEINNWCISNDIDCEILYEYSNVIEGGFYTRQSIITGTEVESGTKIWIYFSLGNEPLGQGTYKISQDLEPGKYIIDGDGYYEVCVTANCSILDGEMLYNDNFNYIAIVILNDGEYFTYSGSGVIYSINDYNRILVDTIYNDGYYEIGVDLESGEYKLNGSGYYAICTQPSCDILGGEMITNGNLTNGGYIQVNNGEYLIISGSLTGEKQ